MRRSTGRGVGEACCESLSERYAWGNSAAGELVELNRGATQRVVEHIERIAGLEPGGKSRTAAFRCGCACYGRSPLPYSLIVRAKAWCYASGILPKRQLPGTLIGVGNLTVGGTGKTPMVLAIAERMGLEGKRTAILTRGYRGTSDAVAKGEAGAKAGADTHGLPQSDEVALLRGSACRQSSTRRRRGQVQKRRSARAPRSRLVRPR